MRQKLLKVLSGGAERFCTFPNERLLFSIREHPLVVVGPLLDSIFIVSVLVVSLLVSATFLHIPMLWIGMVSLVIGLIGLSVIVKLLVDWYFHLYVLTTAKIIEFSYRPLSTSTVNEILLDQVRCTEIDVEMNGLINQFFDKGTIIFTFDRPTHQEEFVFRNIQSPKKIRELVTRTINITKDSVFAQHMPGWYQGKQGRKPFRFIEEIFPQSGMQIM